MHSSLGVVVGGGVVEGSGVVEGTGVVNNSSQRVLVHCCIQTQVAALPSRLSTHSPPFKQ